MARWTIEDQRFEVDGLGHVIVGAHLHGFDGGLDGAEGGDDDDGGLHALFRDSAEKFEAGGGHAEVGDDELRLDLLQHRPGLVAIVRKRYLIASLFELHLHDAAEAAVIIDDEDVVWLHTVLLSPCLIGGG